MLSFHVDRIRTHRPYHTPALFEGSAATKETYQDWRDGHDQYEDCGAIVNMNCVVGLQIEKIVFSV